MTQQVSCNRVVVPTTCQPNTLVALVSGYGFQSIVTHHFMQDNPEWDIEFVDEMGPCTIILTSHDYVGDDWKIMKFYKVAHPDSGKDDVQVQPRDL